MVLLASLLPWPAALATAPKDAALEAKGYVVPAHPVQVCPTVAGTVVWLDPGFEEGKHYKKGERLAELDPTVYRADAQRAEAALAAARNRLEAMEQIWPLERKQADARLAGAKSAMDYRRRERERAQRAGAPVSAKEHDEAEALFEQAARAYDEAQAAVALLAEQGPRAKLIAAAKADVKQAEADLTGAVARLRGCTVLAPTAGSVLSKKVEVGTLVSPAAFGLPVSVCDMADLRDLEVEVDVQERDIGRVKPGQPCRIMPDAARGDDAFLKAHPEGYAGFVSRRLPVANRAKGSITVRVKVVLPEDEKGGEYLLPDMAAVVSFLKGEPR
jgi:multidrug resistance efflux pump